MKLPRVSTGAGSIGLTTLRSLDSKAMNIDLVESARLTFQDSLDSAKSPLDRNRLGQFATPPALSQAIVAETLRLLPRKRRIRFLEPALGTGSFYSALLSAAPNRIDSALGFEIDDAFADVAKRLWQGTGIEVFNQDFLTAGVPAERPNLLVCNPPYVRHHHIDSAEKRRLHDLVAERCGVEVSGLTGLYGYFMLIGNNWLADGGVAVWLVPSEFLEVNYGRAIKGALMSDTILRVHRYAPEEVQFSDALVTSVVLWVRRGSPAPGHEVQFTYGADLRNPTRSYAVPQASLNPATKWTRYFSAPQEEPSDGPTIGDHFRIRRGVATGGNDYFVRTRDEFERLGVPECFLKPVLPSPRHLKQTRILSREDGYPDLPEQLAIFSCNLPEDELLAKHPRVWEFVKSGVEAGVSSGYLCRHRDPWYSQEHRDPSPLLCTYMGRSAFRFICNESKAIATNVYLMLYPQGALASALQARPELLSRVWERLSTINADTIAQSGRVYGGGLKKLEPKELEGLPIPWVNDLIG